MRPRWPNYGWSIIISTSIHVSDLHFNCNLNVFSSFQCVIEAKTHKHAGILETRSQTHPQALLYNNDLKQTLMIDPPKAIIAKGFTIVAKGYSFKSMSIYSYASFKMLCTLSILQYTLTRTMLNNNIIYV